MAVQAGTSGALTHTSLAHQKPTFKPFKSSISINPKIPSFHFSTFLNSRHKPARRAIILSASATAAEEIVEEQEVKDEETSTEESEPTEETQKLGVVVKPMEKPRLVLKFVWLEKNIGLALDQVIPGHGTIPLSPYYFWPRKDAWEELKSMLESKPWISQKRMIILLNQATDIINLWQQSGGNLS
ncbi:Ribosomal protein PSRP-3/Ycf65 [Macleaya cordata]|uniref:30S ribosomal protein 3, chloroplastic n=1 Tax=Macleaya cordata TaxID=56857 RepID=A0A200Q3H9_MACCD|nr:Ribosomal protein PSRP-3/Ycf65 [Macleaya cordata]